MTVRYSPPLRRALELSLALAPGFDAVYALGALPPLGAAPLVLAANHVSWWDGFLLWRLQRASFPGVPVYTVMLEREIEKRRWFRRIGAIGITPGDRASVRRALRRLETLRPGPPYLLSYFPQGRIFPSTRRPLGFDRGVTRFASAAGASLVVPVGLHVEPLTARRPTAFVCVGDPVPSGSVAAVEAGVQAALDRVQRCLATEGEAALARLRALGGRRI